MSKEPYVNHDLNQALIRLKAEFDKFEKVFHNLTDDDRWALKYKYPFKENFETTVKNVREWVDHHYVDIDDLEEEHNMDKIKCTKCSKFISIKPNGHGRCECGTHIKLI